MSGTDLSDLKKLTVVQLKGELEFRNLPITGTKAVLIDRLQGAIDSESTDDNNTTHNTQQPTATTNNTTSASPVVSSITTPSPVLSKVPPLSNTATLSDAERIAARAARFGVDVKSSQSTNSSTASSKPLLSNRSDQKQLKRAASDSKSTSISSKITVNEDADKIAQRAKRFATDAVQPKIPLSAVQQSSEEQEKVRKRAEKFAIPT